MARNKLAILLIVSMLLSSCTPCLSPAVSGQRLWPVLKSVLPACVFGASWLYQNRKHVETAAQIKHLRIVLENSKFDAQTRAKLLIELEQLKHQRKLHAFFQQYFFYLGLFLGARPLLTLVLEEQLNTALLQIVCSTAAFSAAWALANNISHNNFDPESLPEERRLGAEYDRMLTEDLQTWQVLTPEKLRDFSLADVVMPGAVARNLADLKVFLLHPEKAQLLNAKPCRGIMLSGPPGCGKSMIAKAFASSLNFNFIMATGSEFVHKYVGTGAQAIKNLFKFARDHAPCVLFIDEIDSIARARNARSSDGNLEYQRALNQLLAELDSAHSEKTWDGVFVIGATNLIDCLDKALLRAGRLGKILEMSLPDLQARRKLFAKNLSASKFDLTTTDLENLARESIGMNGAKICEVINMALIEVAKTNLDHNKTWPKELLFNSLERVQLGEQNDSWLYLSTQDKTRIAYHEAAHTLAALLIPGTKPLHKVTIISRVGGALGVTLCLPERDFSLLTKESLNAEIKVYLASLVAEKLIFGDHAHGVTDDLEKASFLAKMMVTKYAMSPYGILVEDEHSADLGFSHLSKADLEKYAKQIIDENLAAVEALLKTNDNLTLLHRLAKELLIRKTMDANEVKELLGMHEKPQTTCAA